MKNTILSLAFVSFFVAAMYFISNQAQKELLHPFTKNKSTSLHIDKESHRNSSSERMAVLHDLLKTLEGQIPVKKFPDIIGIGVKKCGTGALALFLSQHPLIEVPSRPETYFFNAAYSKGLQYYQYLMPKVKELQIAMEKTPSYFYDIKRVPQRIRKDLPKAKLILSLCNPVTRAFSDFVHNHFNKYSNKNEDLATRFTLATKEFLSFNQNNVNESKMWDERCLLGDTGCIFSMGIYHVFLQQWMRTFNDSQLLVLNGDEWITKPGELIERIQQFLGLPLLLRKEDFVKGRENGFFCFRRWWDTKYTEHEKSKGSVTVGSEGKELFCLSTNKGRTRNGVRSMQTESRNHLKQFYHSHNQKLYDLLGENFNW